MPCRVEPARTRRYARRMRESTSATGMRVALLGPAAPWRGGIAQHVDGLSEALRARGHETTILSFTRQYPGFLFPGTAQREGYRREDQCLQTSGTGYRKPSQHNSENKDQNQTQPKRGDGYPEKGKNHGDVIQNRVAI